MTNEMMEENQKAKPIKAILIDVKTPGLRPEDRVKEVTLEVEDGYHIKSMYRCLQCDMVEHTERRVEGRWLDIYVDEEGLYAEPLILGAWNGRRDDDMDALAGNLLIVGPVDDFGWDTDVPEGTIELVWRNLVRMPDENIILKLDDMSKKRREMMKKEE